MKRLLVAVSLALAALPATAQEQDQAPEPAFESVEEQQPAAPTADSVHEFERQLFDYGPLRPGRNGDKTAPDAANFDEAKVGDLVPPPLFASDADRKPEGWAKRRAEIAALVEDNWVGRIPDAVKDFRVAWTKQVETGPDGIEAVEHWVGQVIAPDGRTGPVIDATITFPAYAVNAPALIDYTYIWPAGFRPGGGDGLPPPDPKETVLAAGWVHVAYRVQLLQADTAAQMEQGVIGLARWPRERHDWGALRAWGWGASQLRQELALDPRIDGAQVSLAGHSRFGKAVLVAAAFDHDFADALVSSSGAGGAKLMRRDFGEHWYNMAGSYAYHWYTPEVMLYAGKKDVADLPVDAHMLIALRAPRPLFISSGLAEKGDDWVDPRGMWIATSLAEPAWALHGLPVPGSDAMPEVIRGYRDFTLAFYQHDQGHVSWPAYQPLIEHERRFAGGR